MPRLIHRLPVPRLHRRSGKARLRIGGKEHWLGVFGSPEAQAEYDRLIEQHFASQATVPPSPHNQAPDEAATTDPCNAQRNQQNQRNEAGLQWHPDAVSGAVTVTVLVAEFWKWAQVRYRKRDGTPTREAQNFVSVIRRLREKYGVLPVEEFGPARLLELRDAWVRGDLGTGDRRRRKRRQTDLARDTINGAVRRVRQVFRWGVSRELVSRDLLARLETLEPLGEGQGGRETPGTRGAVEWPLVEKTLPALPPLLRAFVTVAFHSGARPSELARLTTAMIDRTEDIWIADLSEHKTAHKGKRRRLFFGPSSIAALTPWLLPAQPDEPIFSPRRVDDRQAKRQGKRPPGRTYGRSSLDQALRRAIDRAGVESWSLGQLRHSAAVRMTDAIDLEASRQALGHSSAAMTRHYAAGASAAAVEAARLVG